MKQIASPSAVFNFQFVIKDTSDDALTGAALGAKALAEKLQELGFTIGAPSMPSPQVTSNPRPHVAPVASNPQEIAILAKYHEVFGKACYLPRNGFNGTRAEYAAHCLREHGIALDDSAPHVEAAPASSEESNHEDETSNDHLF